MDPKLVKERQRIAELLTKTVRKNITSEEKAELNKWVGDRKDRKDIVKILTSQNHDTMNEAIKKYGELMNQVLGKTN